MDLNNVECNKKHSLPFHLKGVNLSIMYKSKFLFLI